MSKYVSHIAIALVMLCLLAGCTARHRTRIIGGEYGNVTSDDNVDIEMSTQVARDYITAWVNKDYRRMYELRCTSTITHWGYKAFKLLTSTWREKGVKKVLGLKESDLDSAQINKSLQVIKYVRENIMKILLCLCTDSDKALDKLKNGQWPDRVIFMSHKLRGKEYIIVLVKEAGKWSVMNDPGQMPRDEYPTGCKPSKAAP